MRAVASPPLIMSVNRTSRKAINLWSHHFFMVANDRCRRRSFWSLCMAKMKGPVSRSTRSGGNDSLNSPSGHGIWRPSFLFLSNTIGFTTYSEYISSHLLIFRHFKCLMSIAHLVRLSSHLSLAYFLLLLLRYALPNSLRFTSLRLQDWSFSIFFTFYDQ